MRGLFSWSLVGGNWRWQVNPTAHAKGAHLLPANVTTPLTATLVRSLDEAELTRALDAATSTLLTEVALVDPPLAARLTPILSEGAER